MKLTELLQKITPLPWLEVIATDGDKWIGTEQGDDRIATLDGNTQALDHTYLVHAASVLPQLMAAAMNLQETWEKNLTEPMARLNEALVLAEEVSVEPKTTTVPRPAITQEQEQALRGFLECWDLSMPYLDIGSALNCGECNALHALLLAFDAPQAARALLEAHAVGDDEGDDPELFRIKTALEES